MAHILPDRVWENCTVSGAAGNIVLTGARTAYRTVASQLATNDTTEYTVERVDGNGNPDGPWEVGIGTMLASGELQRNICISSSNANAFVDFGAGQYHVFLVSSSQEGNRPLVQVFTTEGLNTNAYVKPAWARVIDVICIGSGGPGGSGRRGAVSTVRCGGGGGGGGGYGQMRFPASMIISPVNIHVGNRRPGAAAIAVDNTNGSTAPAANAAPFGYSYFGRYLQVIGGAPGSGGSATAGSGGGGGAGFPQVATHTGGGSGGSASTSGGAGAASTLAYFAASGGGAGGGITSGNTANPGGFGNGLGGSTTSSGWGLPALAGASAGVVNGALPGAGSAYQNNAPVGGGGGGGGAASITAAAQSGGNGGKYGGGGGGGGASLNGFNSGAGGEGAQGIVVVITT
jgi:hypothetical protein